MRGTKDYAMVHVPVTPTSVCSVGNLGFGANGSWVSYYIAKSVLCMQVDKSWEYLYAGWLPHHWGCMVYGNTAVAAYY